MSWAAEVGRVFHMHPRIELPGRLWIERKNAMRKLTEAISRPGGHVCLDGPSGAGKTSLAWTYLALNAVPHVQVQVTKAMTWQTFCMQLIDPANNKELSVSGELEVGLNNALPTAKFRISLGQKERSSDRIELKQKLASQLDETEIAKRMIASKALLLVDDIERASPDLLQRIADLCKVLTQYNHNAYAKIMLIGTGAAYARIYNENPALDERLTQVSMGGFSGRANSVLLATRGFDLLGLKHPWNSLISQQREATERCMWEIWEAADGLPKSLNSLAHSIAMRAEGRRSVSAADIITEAKRMKEQNWRQFAQRFPQVIDFLYSNTIALKVVNRLYRDGIADVHSVFRIKREICAESREVGDRHVEEAINGLVGVDFLVRTGKSGELIFVQHPSAAHTLGVAVRDPAKFLELVELHKEKLGAGLESGFPLPIEHQDDRPSTY